MAAKIPLNTTVPAALKERIFAYVTAEQQTGNKYSVSTFIEDATSLYLDYIAGDLAIKQLGLKDRLHQLGSLIEKLTEVAERMEEGEANISMGVERAVSETIKTIFGVNLSST